MVRRVGLEHHRAVSDPADNSSLLSSQKTTSLLESLVPGRRLGSIVDKAPYADDSILVFSHPLDKLPWIGVHL